jgi:cytochrome c biogenesis protein CcmG/thiol:disulfide interchange protein DsbE
MTGEDPVPKHPSNPARPTVRPRAEARGRTGSRRALRGLLIGLGVVLVAAVGLVATTANGGDAEGSTEPEDFDLPAIQGEGRVRLADFQGTPVVVNFFASWCTACDAELPGFAKVSAELDGQVAVVGVASNETGDPMYMPERHGITHWPLAQDIDGRNGSGLHAALGGRGMPITAFYDAEGNLLHVDLGALPEQALRQRVDDLYGTDTLEAA